MDGAKWATPDSFHPPQQSCVWEGKTYGFTASSADGIMLINVPKFEAKGISAAREDFPQTWDDLKALSAEFIVRENGDLKEVGYVPFEFGSWQIPIHSGLNGGKIFNSDTREFEIDSAENIEWLEYMVGWLDEQYDGDIEALRLLGNLASAGGDSAWGTETSAMAHDGPWGVVPGGAPFEWEVAKYAVGPSGAKSVTGYWPNWFALPSGAQYGYEGSLFIEYFSTVGWEVYFTEAYPGIPVWKGHPTDLVNLNAASNIGMGRAIELFRFLRDYLEDSVVMWNSPIEGFAADTILSVKDEVLHKVKTPAVALQEAQELCQTKLEELLAQA
jgi:hypothetical protein